MCKARFDFITDIELCCVPYKRSVRRPRHNRKAARKRCKRAYCVQSALCQAQAMRRTRNALLQRVPQAAGEKLMAHA